jgi:DNA-binding MarR family transcriptional regulator
MKDIEQSIMKLIHVAGRFQKHPKFSKACGNMSPAEIKLFEVVMPGKKNTMTEIAHMLGTSKGATSLLVDKLVKKRKMTRTYDKQDRRIVYMSLTKEGEKNYNSYLECKHKVLGTITAGIKDFDPELSNELINKLAEQMEQCL